MKKFLLFVCIFYYSFSFGQVKVTIDQRCGLKDITVFYKDGNEGADGVKINDSSTIYTIPVNEPFYLYILTDEATRHSERLWIDPKSHDRKVTIDNCQNKMIAHDKIDIETEDAPRVRLEASLMNKGLTDDSINKIVDDYKAGYIAKHPNSFLAVWYLSHIMYRKDINTLIKLKKTLSAFNPPYPTFKSVKSYIENYKYKSVPQIGDSFFEFQAQKINGAMYDSKNVSDKVVVMFFLYSGCGPCHKAIPSLTDMYNKYNSQGMELISFSFDNKREEWQKSSALYKIPGINVSDLIGFSSPLLLHYAVSSFPFFIVFDRSKKISMITFGEDEVPLVESKVKELLSIK